MPFDVPSCSWGLAVEAAGRKLVPSRCACSRAFGYSSSHKLAINCLNLVFGLS